MIDISKLSKMQTTASYFSKNYPEEYKKISILPPKRFQEKLYWYIHNLTNTHECKICHKPTKFISLSKGYRIYCGCKCMNSDPDKKTQIEKTCIEKYGGKAPACSSMIREKTKKTCNKKYGVDFVSQSAVIKDKMIIGMRNVYADDDKRESIKQSRRKTNIERYGGVGFESEILREKARQTNLDRYNNPTYNNPQQLIKTQTARYGGVGFGSKELLNKCIRTHRDNFINTNSFIVGYTLDDQWICKCPHPETCDQCTEKVYSITCQMYRDRIRSHSELCTKLLPPQPSHSQGTTIEMQIRSWLDNLGIEYMTNDRTVIPPQELDIYIPSHKIAIELNGYFWHSTKFKSRDYHLKKWMACRDKGVQLISIWEDWMINTPKQVQSLLESKLGIYEHRIMARQCKVVQVDSKISTKFLDDNHIQGHTAAQYRYGLKYNGQLVSLMTFGKKRVGIGGKYTSNQYELVRFCNLRGWQVVGGASRLQKHFIRDVHPDSIISWSSNDISTGNLYKKLGYKESGKYNLAYWYIYREMDPIHKTMKLTRYHRYTFSKDQIITKGLAPSTDKSQWTEREVMDSIPNIYRIYDSGTLRWILNLK